MEAAALWMGEPLRTSRVRAGPRSVPRGGPWQGRSRDIPHRPRQGRLSEGETQRPAWAGRRSLAPPGPTRGMAASVSSLPEDKGSEGPGARWLYPSVSEAHPSSTDR